MAVKNTRNKLWVLLTLILIPVQFSHGAVIEDTSSSATLSGGTSISWNHTTGASADRLLLVSVSTVGALTSVSDVTYGGTSLSLWSSESSAFPVTAELWYMVAPPTGTATVEVNFTADTWGVVGATTWTGVDQASPLGAAVVVSGTDISPSVNVASNADNIVVDVLTVAGIGASVFADSTQTERWNSNVPFRRGAVHGAGSSETGAADVAMSWALTNPLSYALVAADIQSGVSTPDTTPPTVDITSPADNTVVAGTTTVDADASDNVGVVGVQFELDGVALGAEDTSAPFSIDWDTTTSSEGDHTLTAVARDAAGNQTISAIILVTVDNIPPPDTTPPTVDITSPAQSAVVSATTTVNADASDNVGVVGVQFELDGIALGAEDTSAPYAVDWDTTTSSDGSHTLTAVARDAAGNQTTSSVITVTVDNAPVPDTTPPTVDITSPADNAVVSATTTVTADASDDVGVVGVQFELDGVALGAEDTSAPYTVDWDTTTSSDGSHTLTAVARDAAGNQATSLVITVTVDNADTTPPTVDITSPADNAVVSATTTVTADASDDVGVVGVQFELDGVALGAEDTSAPYTVDWDTTTSSDGSHTLTAVARDAADNQTTSAVTTVTVDNAVSVGQVVHDASSSATLSGGTSISWNHTTGGLSDRLLLVSVSTVGALTSVSDVTYGGTSLSLWSSETSAFPVTAELWYMVAPPTGTATVEVNFTADTWGVVGATTWTGVDQASPLGAAIVLSGTDSAPSVSVASDADHIVVDVVTMAGIGATVTSDITQTDQWNTSVPFRRGAVHGAGSSETGAADVEMSWTLSNPLSYAIVAADIQAGASAPDSTPPTVDITSPAESSVVSGTTTIAADASDDVGVVGVQFELDGVALGAEDTAAPFSTDWDTTASSDGTHTLTAVARDAAGNQTTSAVITVTVDNFVPPDITPPTVDITLPVANAVVSATTTINADASDDVGVVGVQFELDGIALGAEDTVAPYSLDWDTTTSSDGSYSLTAVARDAAGNQTTSAVVAVTVDNASASPPAVIIVSPADGTSVIEGTVVSLIGTATDVEDGVIDGSIDWSSSLDGSLGTGASVDVTLSVGTHTITASATDSDLETGSDVITLTVTTVGGTSRPNILLILADDMGADTSDLYPELAGDSGQVATPTLSSLAADGIVFDNAWASPVCSPTRGTLASGSYGHNTGVLTVDDDLPASTTTIWEYVAANSPEPYAMGVFGKWHLGDTISHVTVDSGVPEFKGFLEGLIDNYYDWTYISTDGSTTQTTTYATTAITDFAIDFISAHEGSANADDPWFVYVPYSAPHGTRANDGFQVPPADLFTVDVGGRAPGSSTVYDGVVSVYQAVIQGMDTEIGRMLTEIDNLQELDNTIVIFLGDNGTPPPIQDTNVGNRGAKATVYEGGVHVPMIISGAGVTRVNDRETDLVTTSDLYATVAELTGINVSQINNSYSLVPLLTDDNASSGRQFSFTEICGRQYAIRDDRYKVLYNPDDGGFAMYDLQNDPQEQTNLYDDPSVAAEQAVLEAELEVLKQSATSGGCFQ